jgi:hypothetical protein
MVGSGGRRWLWNAELSTHLRGVGSKVLDGGRFAGARETGHVRDSVDDLDDPRAVVERADRFGEFGGGECSGTVTSDEAHAEDPFGRRHHTATYLAGM